MDELVKLVSQKAGINETQARAAAQTVIDFIKAKLPPQMAAQVDALITNPAAADALKNLGGLFGNK